MRTPTPTKRRRRRHALLLTIVLVLAACQNAPQDASAAFANCLTRHGVVAEDVEATLGSDATIESLSVVIVREGDVAYEPVLRLACTTEVEKDG